MEFLNTIFGDKALTFDEFKTAIEADKNIKLVNLTGGKYVDVSKFDKKVEELQSANDTISKLNSEIEQLKENGADVQKLKDTIADYEAKEQKRLDDEKAAKELKSLKERFVPLKGEKTFFNEGTENWIFNEFKNALSLEENKGKSDAEIYETVTKDKNIYTNPNQKLETPPAGGGKQTEKAEFKRFF